MFDFLTKKRSRRWVAPVRHTADAVLFSRQAANGGVRLLLIKRKWEPFQDMWALPGGHVDGREAWPRAASRELFEEAGIGILPNLWTECGVFDAPGRDPRGRYVSHAFTHVLPPDVNATTRAGDDAAQAVWWPLDDLPPLAFDHDLIVRSARLALADHPLMTDVAH